MGLYGYAESLFGAFHKVATATAVHVHFDAARHHVAAFGIEHFCAFDGQVGVGYGLYLVTFDDDGAAFEPALRGEDAAIDDLLQHTVKCFYG